MLAQATPLHVVSEGLDPCKSSLATRVSRPLLTCTGNLYADDLDRYPDRLDDAVSNTGTARIRPDDDEDDPEDS
jgi:hypothetical protein